MNVTNDGATRKKTPVRLLGLRHIFPAISSFPVALGCAVAFFHSFLLLDEVSAKLGLENPTRGVAQKSAREQIELRHSTEGIVSVPHGDSCGEWMI